MNISFLGKLASIPAAIFFVFATPLLADIRGTDNNGKPVILRDNGTWNYIQSGGSGSNLILNGGFEQGAVGNNITIGLTNWTIVRENIDVVQGYWQQIEGNRSVDMAGTYGSGAIQQSFNTIAGSRYQLSFFMAGNPSCDNPAKEMRVRAGNQSATFNFNTQGRSRGQMGWRQAGWSFIANRTQTNLIFESTGPNRGCGIALDDVSVVLGGAAGSATGGGVGVPGTAPGNVPGGAIATGNLSDAHGRPCAPDPAFVASLYQSILDRQPEPAGLNNWIGQLSSGKSRGWVISKFFMSREYTGFGKNNIDFVRDAYQSILGREPEPRGHSHWIRRLNRNLTRDAMIQHFLNSPEYTGIMARCGTGTGGAGTGGTGTGGSGPGTGTGAGTGGSTGGNITWNFETGNINGWVTTGTAFNNQPTFGDNPTARRRGQPSRHAGNYWIGTYEMYQGRTTETPGNVQGDGPKGTMTTNVFTIPTGSVNFLVGGGNSAQERVELLVGGQSVISVTGQNTETMRRVTWDLTPWAGRRGQIRLVDQSSGGWGHINADDFRFENPPTSGGAAGSSGQTSMPGGTSLGCFAENRDIAPRGLRGRVLNDYMIPDDPRMTQEKCVAFCAGNGALYAGVQYGRWCFCGSGRFDAAGPSNACTMQCSGNPAQNCGGPYANEVFSTGAGTGGTSGSSGQTSLPNSNAAGGTQQQVPGGASVTTPTSSQFIVFSAAQTNLEDVDVYEYTYLNWNNANWGAVKNMTIASNSSGVADTRRRIYIRFDHTNLGGPLSPNARVELALTTAGGSGEGDVEARVYAVTSPWQEGNGTYHSGQMEQNAAAGTISWSNQPTFSASRPWAVRMINSSSATYLFNISDLVRAWQSGQMPNYGLVIVGATEGSGRYKFVFHSSEQTDPLWQPKILVTGGGVQTPTTSPPVSTTPPTSPPGQTGQTGPSGATGNYLTCRNNDNVERGCGPHLSAHTYFFAPSNVDRIVDIMWDTGSGLDCKSELRLESGQGNSLGIYGDFTVNSSINGNTVNPSILDIVIFAGTDTIRISDHNTCYIDDSSIRFH